MDSDRLRTQLQSDTNVTMRHLLSRFLMGSLMALVVVTTATVHFSRHSGFEHAITDARKTVSVVGETFIQPQLTAGVVASDPAALDDFDARIRSAVLGDDIVRVKLSDSTGKIVYSDEQRLIGQRFELGAEELGVLASNRTDAELSDLRKPENQYEAPATKLLEVYAKVNGPDGQPLLFEAYFLYATVVKAGAEAWRV
jgi:two-component system, NarL family, sensor kinase